MDALRDATGVLYDNRLPKTGVWEMLERKDLLECTTTRIFVRIFVVRRSVVGVGGPAHEDTAGCRSSSFCIVVSGLTARTRQYITTSRMCSREVARYSCVADHACSLVAHGHAPEATLGLGKGSMYDCETFLVDISVPEVEGTSCCDKLSTVARGDEC